MRKCTMIFISCLFLYSCSDDFHAADDLIETRSKSITFKDKVTENGIPIEGAIVSIYGNNKRYFDTTNSDGEYTILVPETSLIKSGYMSLNVYHPQYKSLNITYKAPLQPNTTYDSKGISTQIVKCKDCLTITNYNYSELFHLGDNNFTGAINSQFQKESDGIETVFSFVNSGIGSKLKINFEAKGIQPSTFVTPSRIIFDDQVVVLEMSPTDGSYKKYAIEFENNVNVDSIKFITSNPRSDGDVDDWEFTSFYVEGLD